MPLDFGKLTTILFDADGTLWDFDQVMRHALERSIGEIERRFPTSRGRLSVETMVAIRDRVAEESMRGAWTHEAIRLEAFKRALALVGHPDDDLAEDLTALYMRHRFEDIRLYEDVLPTLGALRERYTLGLLTNGNTYPERCGLAGCFEFVVYGQDYGLQKPDPRLFEIAIERAGCERHQIANVGDSFDSDVIGARRAGIAAVWLNRQGRRNDTGLEPDREIGSLTELPALLSS